MKIRIGAHPSNLTLTALTHYQPLQQPLLDAGFEPEFLWYPEGKMMHQLAISGKVNVIGTGTTRAVVAQADNVQLAYIGASRPRRSWSSILVPEHSPIHRAEDLAAKRIGFIDGSFQTYFLLATLEQVGLKYADIVPVNLLPGASLSALQSGEVDAWIAMDPYLSAALAGGGLRKIQDCGDVIANRSVFWVLPDVVAAGEAKVRALFDALVATDRWIGEHLIEAGELFARVVANGLTPEEWTRGLQGREWGISAPDEQLFAEQQAEGDLLFRHGLVAQKIDINATRLPFQLHAVEV